MDPLEGDERQNYLLTKQVAGFLVLEEVGAVRQAVGQIRSLVADAINPLANLVEASHGKVETDTRGDAVRALQFADMVEQLGAYCDAELDNVETLARDLNSRVNDILSNLPEGQQNLIAFRESLQARLLTLRERLADRGHKSVLQQDMGEGDIELF